MRRAPITAVTAVTASLLAVTLAACGPQTDERVVVQEPTAVASLVEPSSEAPDQAPSDQAPDQAPSDQAPSSPFVTLDCATGAPAPASEPPAGGATIGDVTAVAPTGAAPSITISTSAQPASELGIADLAEGTGATAAAGDVLTVQYCGVGLDSGSVFESSWGSGQPATFPLDGLIAGWQEGLPGMKVGGTRLLVIPGAMGYGDTGSGPIGPDETLVFVVQLEDVQPPDASPDAN